MSRTFVDVLRLGTGRLLVLLLPPLAAAAAYLPDSVRRSGWSDDFPLLESDSFAKFFADGRPVQGLVFEAVFPDNVSDLAVLRVVGVLGIAALAVALALLLAGWGVSCLRASVWSASIVFLPTFHEYAGWASVFLYSWLSLVGLLAGVLWIDGRPSYRGLRNGVAVLGIVLAMLAYPPAAMFCWVPLGLRILVLRLRASAAFREIVRLGALVGGSALVSLLIAQFFRNLRGIPTDPRVQVITSPEAIVDKIVWFVSHPVVVAARPFSIASPGAIEALATGGLVLAITATGIFFTSKGNVVSRLGVLSAIAVCIALTMAPHLLVPDNQIEYRFMGGLTVLVWGCACIAGSRLFQHGVGWLPVRVRSTLDSASNRIPALFLTFLLPFVAVLAVTNVRTTFIAPSISKEYFLLDALSGFDPSVNRRILIVNHQELWQQRPNLGIYSTTSDLANGWVAAPSIRLLLVESGRGQPPPDLLVVRNDVQQDPGDYIVDLRPYALSFTEPVSR